MYYHTSRRSTTIGRGGWSTNDFRKLQSCGHKKCLRLADLPKIWQFADLQTRSFLQFADLRLAEPLFCGLKTSSIPQMHNYLVISALIQTHTK
jgi:hypothetical protein